jgi:aminopeptidase N
MRRIPLTLLLLAGSLTIPIESQQGAGIFSETREPAPIKAARAPRPGEYAPGFDALHYDIRVTLPATGSVIEGTTEIQLALTPTAPGILPLDFTGLQVTGVRVDGAAWRFVHDDGKLLVPVPPVRSSDGSRVRVAVDYRGTPDDGLIIRDNVHGHRAAFADNWPNRARFWFPALDHPADKATASFTILVPAAWDVVANGVRTATPATIQQPDGATRRRFEWRIAQPISTYNMVIGAADFRVQAVGRPCFSDGRCIDVTTWLFPESADKASPSFRRAAAMVEYFSRLIAPFPYDKLAHVQGSTVFGGMENATAIVYAERPLADGRNIEAVVAHETAHQWFGDAVTETAWPHVWLSEGFATYFGALFFEHADGEAVFRGMMEVSRRQIVASTRNDKPIVDATEQDLFKLLNTNSYQKGAWVLHMLRGSLGDEFFFDGIRRYYRGHEHGTGLTVDLQRAMEAASGKKLDQFFDQWLFRPGYPRLRVSSQWNSGLRTATVLVEQVQSGRWPTFRMPLTIELATAAGPVRRQVDVDERRERYTFQLESPPAGVVLDPEGWLLKDIAR